MKSYIKQSIFALAALGLFTACSSDANEPSIAQEEVTEGIDLLIPAELLSSTRATPTAEEAKINKLVVLAFNTTTNAVTDVDLSTAIQTIDPSNYIGTETGGSKKYAKVPCRLAKGTYRLYLLANIEPGMIKKSDGSPLSNFKTLSENDIKDGTLSFEGTNNSAPNVFHASELTGGSRKYLPMTCWYGDVCKDAEGTVFPEGVVTINAAAKTEVYADLTLAVAKVRFTLYNTKSKGTLLETNGVKISKTSKNEPVFQSDASSFTRPTFTLGTSENTHNLSGNYFHTPESWSSPKNEEEWGNLNVESLGSEFTTEAPASTNDYWIWQSTVYVPERLNTDKGTGDATHLAIKFSNGNEKGINIQGTNNKGIERSTLYDIIGYVDAKVVTLQVRVKPWNYKKYTYDLDDQGGIELHD